MSGVVANADASDVEGARWFFEDSQDPFLVLSGGVVRHLNAAFSRITGWTAEDAACRSLWDLCHPGDRRLLLRSDRLIAGGRMACFEHRLKCKDGRWIRVRCQARRGSDGSVLALLQDITLAEAHRAEVEEAQRSSGLLRTATGISMWRYNPHADAFFYGLDVGEESEGVVHQQRVRPYAQVFNLIHPDDRPVVKAVWNDTLADGSLRILEYRKSATTDQGPWRRVRTAWRGVRRTFGGKWEIQGLTQDLTELTEARDAALRGERAAQQAAETKAQFLANMSHEIRTPMNGVLGVLHLLKAEQLSDEGRGLLDEALACGAMLSELLNDVIDFSKIEAGKLELNPEPVDLKSAVEGVAGMLRTAAEAKGLWLRVAVDDAVGWAALDPVRLRQMLFNLIGNAVKFTLAGGVEARLTVTGADDDRRLRVEIEDTGIGISPDAQRRLFERFSQADGSTTRRFGGSGLGLAISRKLAELMGGDVGLVSTVGLGSTFWFELPAPLAAPRAAVGEADAQCLQGLRILVVEDNPTNRLIATKLLENLGADVSTVCNGAEGVEAVRTEPYDIVFMDVQMPVMDGVEATRVIRALPGPEHAVPILAMTANALSHQRQAYRDAGMDGSVAKPLSPAALIAELARVTACSDDEAATDRLKA